MRQVSPTAFYRPISKIFFRVKPPESRTHVYKGTTAAVGEGRGRSITNLHYIGLPAKILRAAPEHRNTRQFKG